MSAPQKLGATQVGWLPQAVGNSTSTVALNAAGTWLAFSFIVDQPKTLKNVKAFISSVTGSPVTADIVAEIYNDNAGVPGTSLTSQLASAGFSASNWAEFGNFNLVVSRNTMYWIVFKNLNATPASNFVSIFHFQNSVAPFPGAGFATSWGWNKKGTINSGGAWATSNQIASGGWRLEFTDGTFMGFPVQSLGNSVNVIFNTREAGVRFTAPASVRLNGVGISFNVVKVGSPVNNLKFKIWDVAAGTSVITTEALPRANVSASQTVYRLYLDSDFILEAGQDYRITAVEDATTGDSSAAGYKLADYIFENDANSIALIPGNGAYRTYFDGTSWTDTPNVSSPWAIELDSGGNFAPQGAMVVHPGMAGGMRG